jgi:hypothetical protein
MTTTLLLPAGKGTVGRCSLPSGDYLLNATATTFTGAQKACLAAGGGLVGYSALEEQQAVEQCFISKVCGLGPGRAAREGALARCLLPTAMPGRMATTGVTG